MWIGDLFREFCNNYKMKTAILIPYFGKFPVWFDLYMYSCSRNPRIDFLFFTDCELPERIYDNTMFYKTDFDSYCKRVSECLSIDFHPTDSYKLCDLKPFYGIIHKVELEGYDFWGFGDIDLIYGDLNLIVNQSNLEKYDFITALSDRIAGHFTVMRKESKFTGLCMQIPNFKERLESQKNYVVDEVDLCKIAYPQLKNVGRVFRHIVEPLHFVSRETYFNWCSNFFCNRLTRRKFWDYRTTPKPKQCEKWEYDLENGIVTEPSGKSIPYLHFFFFRDNRWEKPERYWQGEYYNVSNAELFNGKGIVTVDIRGIRINE